MHDRPLARTAVLKIEAPVDLPAQVERALAEDIGSGDLTAALIPAEARGRARVITRERAVLCGAPYAEAAFRGVDPRVRLEWRAAEGDWLEAEQPLFDVTGPARALLTAERTALNFLQLLSATATAARRLVQMVEGTRCRVLDTRKTLPGLRTAQKYAVRVGGAGNHRIGLYDAILIKENHIMAAGSIAAAVDAARRIHPGAPIEVEVESLDELHQAIGAGAERALLDEFPLPQMREAVAAAAGRGVTLEASGGIDESNLREVALTGVDYISVGAITKNVRAVDLSMRFEWDEAPRR